MEEFLLPLILAFPLAGGFINAAAGRFLPRKAVEAIACAAVIASLAVALLAFFYSREGKLILVDWIRVGNFLAPMSIYFNALSAIMALMVTFVSSIIHLYSVGFMRDDEDYVRFFCYMNLFVFAMLVVTLADNIIFLYLGWEGVGFCSYALIGFWYADPFNATAGRKAFILTRIGDVAFGIAIALILFLFDDLSLSAVNSRANSLSPFLATVLGILLLWAAVGKSAQLPLSVWLPDAMAGPTPVSALIHAATMVTAGVYLLMRFFPILSLSPDAMLTTALVGGITAFFAAWGALGQRDIKRVLAYSTISQVSYMFLGVGAGEVTGSMFLLLSHAFYKALLFLAAGCVIQALHEEHDIFRMGNLQSRLPGVFSLFLAGSLSLGAIPPFGGFFGKDQILVTTFAHPEPVYKFLWVLGEATAFLTTLYTFRLFFLVFGQRPGGEPRDILPFPRFMTRIIWPLAVLALAAGALNFPALLHGDEWLGVFLASVPGGMPRFHSFPFIQAVIMIISGAVSVIALIVSYFLYRSYSEKPLSSMEEWLVRLFFSGFYLDRLYLLAIAGPYQAASRFLWTAVDESVVDGGFDGGANMFSGMSGFFQLWTTGRLSTYLQMVFLGFTIILGLVVLGWYPY